VLEAPLAADEQKKIQLLAFRRTASRAVEATNVQPFKKPDMDIPTVPADFLLEKKIQTEPPTGG
jgi:hypothetical protein